MKKLILHIVGRKSGGEYLMSCKIMRYLSTVGIGQSLLTIRGNNRNSLNSFNIFDEEIVTFSKIKNSINVSEADLIFYHHIFNYSSIFTSGYIKFVLNKNIIAIIHTNTDSPGNLIRKLYYGVRKFFISNYLVFVDVIVFLTEAQKSSYKKYCVLKSRLDNKSLVIPNFIDNKTILVNKQIKNKLNIIFVGRLSKFKGYFDLMKLRDVLDNDIKIHVVGRGKIQKNNHKGLIFYDQVDNDKIFSIYDKCNVFILPSYTEVFPLSVLEAMARGLVILVSDIAGMREIVKDGRNGYLFFPGDIQQLKTIILYLKNHPEVIDKISKDNLKDVKKFTERKQAFKYLQLINSVGNFNS